MPHPDSPLYQKAFIQYLRCGTPIELSLKAMMKASLQVTPRYVWLTAGDEKVRASHAANDGQIFSWDDPPPTGNPGEEENCRCVAVPYADVQDAALLAVAITPLNRAWVVGSYVMREAIRRVLRWEEVPAKPAEAPPLPKPENIPKNWEKIPSKKGDGVKYVDPKKSGNEVRVQRGNPTSSNAGQRQDYVTWKRNGHYLDKYGNEVPRRSLESHIPIDEFKFKLELFK